MIILSIGTNIGDREQNIENAIVALGEIGKVTAISPIYTSEPWGFESENGFYNIALTMESELLPLDLLRETQRIEKELGRTAKTTTEYADRVIDIDIIDYDGQIITISQQSTVNSQQQNVVTQRVVSDDPMEQNNSQFSIKKRLTPNPTPPADASAQFCIVSVGGYCARMGASNIETYDIRIKSEIGRQIYTTQKITFENSQVRK